jgi:hypothetical protein
MVVRIDIIVRDNNRQIKDIFLDGYVKSEIGL